MDQIPYVDFETEQKIAKNLQEIQNGNYDLLDFNENPNALKNLLNEEVSTEENEYP